MIALAMLQQDSLERIRAEVAVAVRQDWEVVLLVVGLAVLIRLALSVPRRLATARLERPGELATGWDDFALRLVQHTGIGFATIVALAVVPRVVDVAPGLLPAFRFWGMVAALLQAALWGNAAISFGIHRLLRRGGAERQVTVTAATALGFAARVLLVVVLLVIGLDLLGVRVTTLVAGLGIGGIVVALALQSVLTDLIGALSIVLNRPFLVGDFIQAGQHLGTVEYVGLRSTRIRSLPGQELHLPNTYLLQNAIFNLSRMGERRVSFALVIAYDTPTEALARVGGMVREVVGTIPTARFDRAHLKTFSHWGHEYEIVYWILSPDYVVYMDARERINLDLLRRLETEGIRLGTPAAATLAAAALAGGADSDAPFARGR